MNSDIEEIKSRLNIVDVLGEYIRLEKAGANYRAACPFHNEKTPSFMVSEEKQIWHCFGCQKGGDIFGFVMEMDGLEFKEALKILAEKAGVQLKNYNPKKTQDLDRTLEILELTAKWYEYQLWNGPGKNKILPYLRERGLKDATIKEFRLGYAPKGWRNILSFLLSRSFRVEEIVRTGLLVEKKDTQVSNSPNYLISNKSSNIQFRNDQNKNTKYKIPDTRYYDRFRERIMFPIADFSGRIVGYSARVAPGGDETQAKYVNTPETEVYHKSRILYGIDKAKPEIKKEGSAFLVEGNMDVIAAYQAGIQNVVAVSGTALTLDHLKIIKRYAPKIKMAFDMDSAGEAATKKSAGLCLAKGIEVEVVTLPQGKDAAELAKANPQLLSKAVSESLGVIDYFLKKSLQKFDKATAEGKRKISEDLLEVIASLENMVEKNHWLKKLSQVLDVSEEALTDELKKASLKNVVTARISPDDKMSGFSFQSKTETLFNEIIGLMLAYPEAWKDAEKELVEIPQNDLFGILVEKGEKCGFDFEIFLREINDRPDIRQKAEKIYFQKKYRLDLNNNLEEITVSDPVFELKACASELKKEFKKAKLAKLTVDLKLAETEKDKKTVEILRQEYNKISKELAQLIK